MIEIPDRMSINHLILPSSHSSEDTNPPQTSTTVTDLNYKE